METTAVAQMTYMFTRTALELAPQQRAGAISGGDEHRLLEAVEQIADMTNRPSRVVWLELVEGHSYAEAAYAAELRAAEGVLKANAVNKQAVLRQKALAMLGME